MASGRPRPHSSRTSVARAIMQLRVSRIPLRAMRGVSGNRSNRAPWQPVGLCVIRLQWGGSGSYFAALYLHIPDMRIGGVTPVRIIVGTLQTEGHRDIQARCLWEVALPILTNWQSIARQASSQRHEISPSSTAVCLDCFWERKTEVSDLQNDFMIEN